MPEPLELDWYLKGGCAHARLGRSKVPPGYAVLLNSDQSHFFWIGPSGEESCIDWNKWNVLRGARAHAAKN